MQQTTDTRPYQVVVSFDAGDAATVEAASPIEAARTFLRHTDAADTLAEAGSDGSVGHVFSARFFNTDIEVLVFDAAAVAA